MEKIVFCFLVCFLASAMASYKLDSDLATKVKEQIGLEMQASIFYQTYGHYFEKSSEALHGFANLFFEKSLKEKKRADKLMTYLNKRDVTTGSFNMTDDLCSLVKESKFCGIVVGAKATKLTEKSPVLYAIKDALVLEKKIYIHLKTTIKGEDDTTDFQLNYVIVNEYMNEKVKSIKELLDFKEQLHRIGTKYTGILLLDQWLLNSKKTES